MTTKQLNVSIVFNQSGSSGYRVKKLKGIQYYVCPVAMLMEGVFTCNEGAVYYRKDELHTFQESWNNKPVVIEHPTNTNGDFVLAATPAILEKSQVGFLLNSQYDKKLRAMAWIDVERCKLVEPKVIEKIEAGEPMEVSTGLVVNCEVKAGKYKGKSYEYIATDYRPDHLAILMTKKGACSLADGAGLLVMQDGTTIPEELTKSAQIVLDKMVANQLTHSRLRELLQVALKEWAKGTTDSYVWIEDVADNFVIFAWGSKLYRIGYKKSGDNIVLDKTKDPPEVTRVMQYRLVDGTVIGNESTDKPKGESSVKKDEMIGFLIANAGYDETDKPTLEAMEDAKLTKLCAPFQKKPEPVIVANQEPAPAKTKEAEFDWDTFMSKAPKNVQRMLNQSMTLMNQVIEEDSEAVVKLSGGEYTAEECKSMNPAALSKLKKTLANAAAKRASSAKSNDGEDFEDFEDNDYSGASGFSIGSRFMSNSSEDEGEEAPLGLARPSFVPAK